ncbi:YbgA family protein [Vibrio splendidus]|uniref:YbgA family protein n=1 Tax=Vibrio splendidus TaxID=29497 RepID=UPI000D3419E6|nr:DUF523 and DUF1722 domain-containing protein [Vibrio splendidus]PTO70738.1 hypothetical protein CWN96_02100 [Vibrio splendidus]
MDKKIKIGISACVAGHKVRFDTGHKRSRFCTDDLADYVELEPVCPEMGIGLPTPRPTIRQTRMLDDIIHVSRPDGSGDVTDELIEFGQNYSKNNQHIAGFIVCQKSPTCGMERVKIYHHHGRGSESTGVGLFTKQVMEGNPLLPVEENGRLNDPILRENFMTRVFTYQKWLDLVDEGVTKHKLIQFHSAHKYLVMCHHIEGYKSLGKLLASNDLEIDELAEKYIEGLMTALMHHANRGSHANTLHHLQGYFKKQLSSAHKQELTNQISSFREGLVPLLVPLTLINHYLMEYPNEYLQSQVYLNPHPQELKLRYGY